MKAVSILAILVAIAALGFALQSSRTHEDPARDARDAAVADRIAALEKRIDALSADQTRLVQAAAAPAAGDADAHVKDVVRAELQAQMTQMRGRMGAGAGGAGGQGGAGGRGAQAPQIDAATIKEQLGFDDAKSEKVAQAAAELRTKIRDIWRSGGDAAANQAAMEQARAQAEAKAAEFLTPDEMTKVKAWVEKQESDRRARWQQRQGGDAGGAEQPAKPAGPQF
jgi:hypothetical protein